jgi:hypothetical protein
MLLDQFGGANGELAAAMQYSVQGLNCDRIRLFGEVTESMDLYAASFLYARVSSDQQQSNLVIAQPRHLAPCDLTERRDHLHGFCTLATSHRVRAPWSEITTVADARRQTGAKLQNRGYHDRGRSGQWNALGAGRAARLSNGTCQIL